MTDTDSGKRLNDADLVKELREQVEAWSDDEGSAFNFPDLMSKAADALERLTTSGGDVEERARELLAVAYSTIHVSDGTKEALIRAGKNPSIPANAAVLAVSQALSQSPPHACCEGMREKAAKVADTMAKYHVMGSAQSGWNSACVNIADNIRALPLPVSADRRDAWQPIETAPKDGTEILLYRPAKCGRPACYAAARYLGYKERVPTWGWVMARSHETVAIFDEPTNWRPLPSPPAKSKKPYDKEGW